jgi:hypothetical protein
MTAQAKIQNQNLPALKSNTAISKTKKKFKTEKQERERDFLLDQRHRFFYSCLCISEKIEQASH